MDVRDTPPPAVDASARGRPSVSVVVPFAGDRDAAQRTVDAVGAIVLGDCDEGILADNTPDHVTAGLVLPDRWRVVHARGEASPARARNAGALVADGDWLLFVDSDCRPVPDLVDRYFETAIDERCGAVAGRIVDAPAETLAGRFARSRGMLDQGAALASAAGAWAHTANLLVRRDVWRSLGGFLEGVLNAEDVDFCWRVQRAGWDLAYNPNAGVAHEHRASVRGLWRQRVVQVASARWVHRRWPDAPSPQRRPAFALTRALVGAPGFLVTGRPERARMKLLDGVMAIADVVGQAASNRARALPPAPPPGARRPIQIWTDQFPVLSETFVVGEARALAALGHPVEVLALERPAAPALGIHDVHVRYLEDDTTWERTRAFAWLVARHPLAVVRDRLAWRRWREHEAVPAPWVMAPAIRRLAQTPDARVHVHFAAHMALMALRAGRITRRPWSLTAHAYDIYLLPRNLEEKVRAAALVTSGCDYTVRDLQEVAGAARADRVERIVMGVDPEQFVRTRRQPPGGVVVAVGRLVEKKGFIDLVRAAAEPALATVLERVTIIGDGPLRDELQREIERLGLDAVVELVGKVEPSRVRDALESATVLAMPCVVAADGDRDSMPVVVKEALAMEIPVVVSDAVGLPELARPEFARVVPAGDHVALSRALGEVLGLGPAERDAMGRAGRAFVAEHANIHRETGRLSTLLEYRLGRKD